MVGPANFEYRETPLSNAPLDPGDVLVRNKTFSLIPAQRTWMNADSEYFPPIAVGAAVSAPATGEVVQSANPRFPVGMRVTGLTRWEDYSLIKADRLTISPLPADVDLLDALSVFGGNALTAYLRPPQDRRAQAGRNRGRDRRRRVHRIDGSADRPHRRL